jgi:ribosomal protein L37E
MNTETKAERRYRLIDNLRQRGFSYEEANTLRRIEMTLSRWSELECGGGNDYGSWAIERDDESSKFCTQCGHKSYTGSEGNCDKCNDPAPIRHVTTGKPYMVHHHYRHGNGQDSTSRHAIADREKGALRRLDKIMTNHPDFVSYHQGDPRGCALYIVRKSDLNGSDINSTYTRGLAVCD